MTSGYLELKPRDEATAREELAAQYERLAASIESSNTNEAFRTACARDLRARASRLRTANQFQTIIESAKT